MATTFNLTSTYAGKAALDMLTPMFMGLNNYNGTFTVHRNVSYKMPLVRTTMGASFRAPGAAFNPGGTITTDEKVLYPQQVEAQWQVNKNEMRSMWDAEQARSAWGATAPQSFIDAINKNAIGMQQDEFRKLLFTGVNALNGMDGLYTQLKAASDTAKPTWAAVTSANVISKLGLVVDDSSTLKWKNYENSYLFIAPDVASAYTQAVASGNNYRDTTAPIPLIYMGYKMVVVPDLIAGTILFIDNSNFHVGFNETDAAAYLDIIDTEYTTGDKYLRITAGFSIDVKVGFTAEAVAYYNPA